MLGKKIFYKNSNFSKKLLLKIRSKAFLRFISILSLIAFLQIFSESQLFANDSVAEIGTGGLVFVRSDAISLDKEELFISLENISVAYKFRNHRKEDIEAIVAFPMPDIQFNPWGETALPEGESDNFLGFSVMADGIPIKPALEQRAYAAGLDVTEDLKKQGIPLFPFRKETFKALERLPKQTVQDWVVHGILHVESFDTGDGRREHRQPLWILKSTYWWRMKFPGGGIPVMVEHSYKPSVGGTVGLNFMEEKEFRGSQYEYYKRHYCIDENLRRALLKRAKEQKTEYPQFFERRITYVLKTGGNWRGPITDFHLVIDKGDPKNLVSFCGENVRRLSPTVFEMTKRNFYPEQDLDILFLSPSGYQP